MEKKMELFNTEAYKACSSNNMPKMTSFEALNEEERNQMETALKIS